MVRPPEWPVPTFQAIDRHFTDPEAFVTTAAAGHSRFLSVVGRSFRAEFSSVLLDRVSIGGGDSTAPVINTPLIPPGMQAFVFAMKPSAPRNLSGRNVEFGEIFAFRPGSEATSAPTTREPWPYALIALPSETLDTAAANLGFRPHVRLNDERMFRGADQPMTRLRTLVGDAMRMAREEPWMAAMPEPARALSGAVREALLECLTTGREVPDRAARHRHRALVSRLMEAGRFTPETLLSLPEICAWLDVPQSTLNVACREFLGVSTMQYTRLRRLDHARHRLRLGGDQGNVTSVATGLGFWELGRFAVAYRARFGESPSETLRRGQAMHGV
jgi:AraC-like DNA-binding protein